MVPDKWDLRFLDLAYYISNWSKDPSTKTGAVIVRPDRTICSLGYNGFPRSMPDEHDYYSNREEKYSRIIHCEMNALLNAKEPVFGYSLYTTGCSCDRCFIHMVQAGINRFVFDHRVEMDARWKDVFSKTEKYARECGVEFICLERN